MPARAFAAAALTTLLVGGCAAGDDTIPDDDDVEESAAGTETDAAAGPDGAPETEPEATASDEGSGPEEPDDDGSSAGTVTVGGIEYSLDEVRSCDPLQDAGIDRELELQGLGTHEGERVQVDVSVQTIGGAPFDDVSWAGPEGVFGSPESAEVVHEDGRIIGAATLVDGLTQTETVDVEFVMDVPAETVACR
ncbi:hypothetical protein UQW22_09445 [Isoptericola halotolerans]|uniref:hypothetical protein n=1 Tax=Isoptericola halotolerans TaxID=300560 RepID=UPI00388E278F